MLVPSYKYINNLPGPAGQIVTVKYLCLDLVKFIDSGSQDKMDKIPGDCSDSSSVPTLR